jgi:hypothetical protein
MRERSRHHYTVAERGLCANSTLTLMNVRTAE